MPGVYREEPSRADPEPDPRCANDYDDIGGDILASGGFGKTGRRVANFEYQRKCPNAQNLIAIIGDTRTTPTASATTSATSRSRAWAERRSDVMIEGERPKLNVIRADRADGIYLRNFTVEFSDFNNIYVLETNGFRMQDIGRRVLARVRRPLVHLRPRPLRRTSRRYGNGDSGIYPGSGPEGHCQRYGIEIRNVNSHDNTLGYSGTAGNGVWTHDNKFHDNATGIDDRLVRLRPPGHAAGLLEVGEQPDLLQQRGLLQRRARRVLQEHADRAARPKIVCPTFQVAGRHRLPASPAATATSSADNYIYDNWRDGRASCSGSRPRSAATRPDDADGHRRTTTQFTGNKMGVRPDGKRDPNGIDFWWDEQGKGNCWRGNTEPRGAEPSSNAAIGSRPARSATASAPATRPSWPPGPVRDLGPDDNAGPARLRLVHPAARARGRLDRHERRRARRGDRRGTRLRRPGRLRASRSRSCREAPARRRAGRRRPAGGLRRLERRGLRQGLRPAEVGRGAAAVHAGHAPAATASSRATCATTRCGACASNLPDVRVLARNGDRVAADRRCS